MPVGDGIEDSQVAIDCGLQACIPLDVAMMNPTNPPEDRMQRPHGVLKERLSGDSQDQLVDAPVENVELFDRHTVPSLAQKAFNMQELVAV
jgi:hypothetical protein